MPELAAITTVLADRTRTRILQEPLGGVPLPAGALAVRVGVAASTVSGHLVKLEDAGLVAVEPRGRRREVRLAGPAVAEAIEALGRLAPDDAAPVGLREVNRLAGLRRARTCYDHLAGLLGVALADALMSRGALVRSDGAFAVADGAAFAELGVDVGAMRLGRRPLARACLDWTERRDHLAGAAGAALLASMIERGWLERRSDSRALRVTGAGERALAELCAPAAGAAGAIHAA